jgi:ferric-dicitrate binding protein FerR (iron transport regulator)
MGSEEDIILFNSIYNSLQPSASDWDDNIYGIKKEVETSIKKEIWEKTGIAKPVVQMRWFRWVAAAAVLILMLGSAAYLVFYNNNAADKVAKGTTQKERFRNDIPPGGNKAVLTLADGSTIILDNVQNGTLAQQGNTKVIKEDGKLAYNLTSTGINEVLYNTISTPRGGQYQVDLPDGSRVWLNAASSLHFPTAFVGKERRVEITGEAYFEVAKNKAQPFIVSVNGAEVQVLGTHFNVMAYNDENAIKTTLLEGSVKFVNGSTSSLLKPGQQSQLSENGQVKVVSNVDVDAVTAWKNGNFDFQGEDIETVMRQLSRWYNVDVVYRNKPDELFYAEIPRNTKLSDVLKALELTGKLRFGIEGKKIIVML